LSQSPSPIFVGEINRAAIAASCPADDNVFYRLNC
jgi:hypothetical protein